MDLSHWAWIVGVQWPAKVAGLSAAVGAAAASAAAITGIRTLRRARLDSKNRNRPMVAAELRDDEHADGVMLLVIRNYGPTVARNLRVTFSPPIPQDDALPPNTTGSLIRMRYEKPISVLTPGMELDNIWYVAAPGDRNENDEGLADQFSVHFEYEGDDGTTWRDGFDLDVDLLRKRSYVTSSNDPREQIKKAVEHLGLIARSMSRSR
jgi:hypothetical protein